MGAPVPEADPEAFLNLGAVAIPAITGSALIDGLLLGKVAFLKGMSSIPALYGHGQPGDPWSVLSNRATPASMYWGLLATLFPSKNYLTDTT